MYLKKWQGHLPRISVLLILLSESRKFTEDEEVLQKKNKQTKKDKYLFMRVFTMICETESQDLGKGKKAELPSALQVWLVHLTLKLGEKISELNELPENEGVKAKKQTNKT